MKEPDKLVQPTQHAAASSNSIFASLHSSLSSFGSWAAKSTRVFFCRVLMIAGFATVCLNAQSQTSNTSLTIYIVHEEKIEDGRYIDTPDLPKTGYIASKPDLDVTNLLDIYPQKPADEAIMVDTNGKPTVVPSHGLPALAVVLPPDDAKRFAAL